MLVKQAFCSPLNWSGNSNLTSNHFHFNLAVLFVYQTDTLRSDRNLTIIIPPSKERNCVANVLVVLMSQQRCTIWCTITKATKSSKSSMENIKVICFFTFISTQTCWVLGLSSHSAPFTFSQTHVVYMHLSLDELQNAVRREEYLDFHGRF